MSRVLIDDSVLCEKNEVISEIAANNKRNLLHITVGIVRSIQIKRLKISFVMFCKEEKTQFLSLLQEFCGLLLKLTCLQNATSRLLEL